MSQPIDTASVAIVPDFDNFARELKSGIDAALKQLVRHVDQAFEQVERSAGEAGADIGREIQSGGESAERALREVSSTARREMAQVSASSAAAGSSIRSRLGGALTFITIGLGAVAAAAGLGLAALTGFGLKSAAAIEQTTIGLQALTGSAEAAKGFLEELQQFAAATPFEFGGVADAARRILAFGTSVGIAREEVIPTLTVIGDLVSVLGGTQQNVDSVVRALSQMASKGKLSQEEILQLAEALPGFNANAAIAAATGMSVSETLERITAGEIDATTGINALLTGMAKFPGAAGAMKAQSETLTGVFSTFKDTISIALSDAFQPVIPEIKETLKELTPIVGQAVKTLAPALGGLLVQLGPLLQSGLSIATPILGNMIDLLGVFLTAIEPAIGPLAGLFDQLVVALTPLLTVFGGLAADLLVALVPALLELVPVIQELTPSLLKLALAVAPLIPPLAQLLVAVVSLLVPAAEFLAFAIDMFAKHGQFQQLALVLSFVADMIAKLSEWLTSLDWNAIWAAIVNAFSSGAKAVSKWVSNLYDAVRDYLSRVFDFAKSLPGRVLAALGNLGSVLFGAGMDLVRGLWNGISSLGGWLYNKVKSFVYDNTVGIAKRILGISSPSKAFADEVGRQIPAGIAQGVNAGMGDLQALLSPIVPSGNTGASTSTTNLGGITLNLMFSGVTPTEGEARRAGRAAVDGALETLLRRNIALAVRTT